LILLFQPTIKTISREKVTRDDPRSVNEHLTDSVPVDGEDGA
jgi:hypothetical protein